MHDCIKFNGRNILGGHGIKEIDRHTRMSGTLSLGDSKDGKAFFLQMPGDGTANQTVCTCQENVDCFKS